jgi:ACR3 family arsenite efflux pump ArsB
MTRQDLEKLQVWIYLVAILTGLLVGARSPASGAVFETLLWPVLACLLYATFTQVPLARLQEAFQDARFMGAILVGNFLVIPGLVVRDHLHASSPCLTASSTLFHSPLTTSTEQCA